ncbi:carbohydrate diacid transcriptional activator CdaR [Salmonella enterica subsp. enterica]|nr:carbohydrate diacid transcriptional activator CdaR [Salmonella enterica subsp. enterica]
MAGWHLDTKMAQDIVARTMRIIDTNINVMDAPRAYYRQRRSGTYW